jgi:uncharacterized membrane protein
MPHYICFSQLLSVSCNQLLFILHLWKYENPMKHNTDTYLLTFKITQYEKILFLINGSRRIIHGQL